MGLDVDSTIELLLCVAGGQRRQRCTWCGTRVGVAVLRTSLFANASNVRCLLCHAGNCASDWGKGIKFATCATLRRCTLASASPPTRQNVCERISNRDPSSGFLFADCDTESPFHR